MTLSTDMYVQKPVDLHALKYVVQAALAEFDEYSRTPDQQLWDIESSAFRNTWSTVVGQGLPARTWIHLGAEDAWAQPNDEYADDSDYDEDGEPALQTPKHFALINFDTAYGYRDAKGQGCAELHMQLMTRVGKWLDEQSVPWKWRDEFTGDIHDAYDGFDTFGKW
jgi:hypothetical protein